VQNGTTFTCDGFIAQIIEYDLTYIDRNFPNLAQDGQHVGTINFDSYAAPWTYKLRGAWGDGTAMKTIYIPDLRIHHTFGIQTWLYLTDANAERTIFSHDTTTNVLSNMIDIVVTTTRSIKIEFAHPKAASPDVDQFNGDCKTNENSMTAQNWHFVGISIFFEGTDTIVDIFQDGTTVKTYDGVKIFFEDSYDTTRTWLMMARQKDGNNIISGENPWSGYMYNFVLYNTQMSLENVLDSSVYGNNCPAGCIICPGHNTCLWTAGID